MDINASDIYSFYNSRLGTIVKRNIRHQLNTHLNSVNDSVICGYGYTNPFLSFLSKQNKNLQISSMQPEFLDGNVNEKYDFEHQIIHEYFLPLDPSSVDVVISTHLLEFVDKPQSSIEEIWRILKPNGLFLSIIPRRSGIWTRYDNNPFGFGRSYSNKQFKSLIQDFLVLDYRKTFLHFPPWSHYLNYKSHRTIEKIGKLFFPYMGGLMICVCKKIVYAKSSKKQKKIPIKNFVPT